MRTLFVENQQKISIKEGLLRFFDGDKDFDLALCDVGALVIANTNTTLSVATLHALDAHDVLCLVCDAKHMPVLMMLNLYKYHRLTTRLKHQMQWSDKIKQQTAQSILFHKVLAQQKHLALYQHPEADLLDRILDNIEENHSIQNQEALAARVYFKALFGKGFVRFEDDFVNHALNYAYVCLSSLIAQTIVAKGLHPALGIMHDSSFNNFNLVYDLIEVYRPLADFVVFKVIHQHNNLTKECKKDLLSVFNGSMMFQNRKVSVKRSIELYVDSLIRHMEEGLDFHLPEVIFEA